MYIQVKNNGRFDCATKYYKREKCYRIRIVKIPNI